MSSINCEINLILAWSANCIICEAQRATTFQVPDTKRFVPVVTLSTQDSIKLMQQLKSGYKSTINWE